MGPAEWWRKAARVMTVAGGCGQGVGDPRASGRRERRRDEATYFFSRVFLRIKVTSFLISRMRTRRPTTPPTTDTMMSVSVLSTSSTGGVQGGHLEPSTEPSTVAGQGRLSLRPPYLGCPPGPPPPPPGPSLRAGAENWNVGATQRSPRSPPPPTHVSPGPGSEEWRVRPPSHVRSAASL